MSVTAVGVVGDDDVRTQVADDGDERADGFAGVGVDEPLPVPRRRARHARITPPAGPAEENRAVDSEGSQRAVSSRDAVAAELVGAVDGQLGPALADHFAFLAERAGDDPHLRAAGRVMRDGPAGGEGLVVGVRVDEEQAWESPFAQV